MDASLDDSPGEVIDEEPVVVDEAAMDVEDDGDGDSDDSSGEDVASSEAPDDEADAVATYASATLTPGWTRADTCEWRIDESGCLTLRPLGNGASATIVESYNLPKFSSKEFTSFKIEGRVKLYNDGNLFSGCSSLKEADLTGLQISGTPSYDTFFNDCPELRTVKVGSSFDSSIKLPQNSATGRWTSSADGYGYEKIEPGVAATYTWQTAREARGT